MQKMKKYTVLIIFLSWAAFSFAQEQSNAVIAVSPMERNFTFQLKHSGEQKLSHYPDFTQKEEMELLRGSIKQYQLERSTIFINKSPSIQDRDYLKWNDSPDPLNPYAISRPTDLLILGGINMFLHLIQEGNRSQ